MKIWSIILSAALALSFGFASTSADAAKRLGGGKSVGQQSSNVTKRDAAPAAPAAAPGAAAAPAAAAAAPKKPWGAMLGGLAAGLGLAWLASSLGFGGAMANILMFALLALVAVVVIGFVMRKIKGGSSSGSQVNSPFAMQGAGNAATPKSYSPENVGNDASARPWERNSMAFDSSKQAIGAGTGSMIGAGLTGSQSWGVPAGFDAEGFLKACKANFLTLQDAWDKSDINNLRAMMTDDMLKEIKTQLAERESHTGAGINKTDVQMLEAKLLGIEETTDVYLASVEFSGMILEDASVGASSFREVWNMTKPRDGTGGWLVAGVQALQ